MSEAKYILKIDDNAKIDYNKLSRALKNLQNSNKNQDMDIFCPSPMRNFKPAPYRQWAGYDTVVGKWSTKFHEFPERVFPDFCLGFGYILTPKLAGILSHATGMMPKNQMGISRLEDIFLTGLTRR